MPDSFVVNLATVAMALPGLITGRRPTEPSSGGVPNMSPEDLLPFGSTVDTMPKTVLSEVAASETGALCLDGTPPAYYKNPGMTNSTVWVLSFEGGGWSYTPEMAADRAEWANGLGSSKLAADNYTWWNGPLCADPDRNPPFYDANRVLLWYCDGGSFAGDLDEPLDVDGQTFWIRGKRIVDALLSELLANEGLDKATDVLLTGTSAGGLAAYLHADYVASLLPDTVTRFGVAPISGFFLNHADLKGDPTYGDELRNVFEYQNSTGGVNADCIEAKGGEENGVTSDCIFANETTSHLQTPLFVINSNVDSWQLENIWRDATECCSNTTAQFQSCSDDQVNAINAYGGDFLDDLMRVLKSDTSGNGYFIEQCLEHVQGFYGGYLGYATQGVTLEVALATWWASIADGGAEATANHTYVPECMLAYASVQGSSSVQCNPTCIQ